METPDDWSDEQQEMFGKVYRFMQMNRETCCHPEMPAPADEHWNTLCFNAAFLAASVVGADNLTIRDLDTEAVLATTEGAKLNG